MFYNQTVQALKKSIGPKECELWSVQLGMTMVLYHLNQTKDRYDLMVAGKSVKEEDGILFGPQDFLDGATARIDRLVKVLSKTP